MKTVIALIILVAILSVVISYLVREKRKGVQCVGCPHAAQCAKKSCCSGSSCCH
ncbi:MAG: FeoB-associated Cys-rich membrane protein [Clostridiales bacterium]|nr:FeoB-associated Cys-rich membrane protein [Candidatus Crickella merdequi]